MKTATQTTLSTVPIVLVPKTRITPQTIHILTFIHRFRHVTPRHIQLSLRHATVTTTHNLLNAQRAKGYIERHYTAADRASNRAASYHLTPEGLRLLQAQNPEGQYRGVRSIKADAIMGMRSRERYHALADVYAYFKRHYDGCFEFFTTFDIAKLDYVPDEVPDGYVRLTLPDVPTQHYFIEIHGWGRSTHMQRRRIHSYMQFAESESWQHLLAEPKPSLFVVAASRPSQRRLNAQLSHVVRQSSIDHLSIYTTILPRLDSDESTIWHNVPTTVEL